MEKTRRVGVLTKRVIELLELELPEGKDILLPAVKSFIREVDVKHHCMRVALIEGME